MVSKRKKKYTTGEGAQFISRKQALKKLQLSLKDFRKLCVLKGIYPREPRNRKRAQKGHTGIKILYHVKDIQFLLQEPIIWKLRDYKIFHRRVGRAKAIRDFESLKKYLNNHPTLRLDHIVKERYPTFLDALRDLDDCLSLCFLFSTFPSISHLPPEQSALCRRLTIEFLHAIIEMKALRKVFVSIKGYYYQADIQGETITWITPHYFPFQPQNRAEIDFKLMSIFVEFYTVLLGFVNYRLYHSLNLYYPPKFTSTNYLNSGTDQQLVDESIFVSEKIAALNCPLSKSSTTDENPVDDDVIDTFTNITDGDDTTTNQEQVLAEARKEAESIKDLKTLFKGLKIFINREVPREPLVFIIRCFGGEISWDNLLFVGATFDENDETITHQIVDRSIINKQFISRYYIQPQWVFDCVNSRQLQPVNKYFIGEVLPPHLSPFVDKNRTEDYVPPEERALYDPSILEELHKMEKNEEKGSGDDGEEECEDDKSEGRNDSGEEAEGEENETIEESSPSTSSATTNNSKKLSVSCGEVYKDIPWKKNRREKQEYRLREKMIKKKHRKLYKKMMEGKQERAKEIWLLRKKRRIIEGKHDESRNLKKQKKTSNFE